LSQGQLLIATSNEGKLRELRSLLAGLPLELATLTDFPDIKSVDETGSTFAENASLKASGYARQAKALTIADDSGLVVDALGGQPGVLSARYIQPDASYPERITSLLRELENSRDPNRSARFVCAMAVATSAGEIIFVTEKSCEGRIAAAPRGNGGFGYDPIFIPDGYDGTFAELPAETKNLISHRALALEAARGFIASLTVLRTDR
jgi:non-canonical purine NTP pyrophosphatase (RdgB/HAM1 family)